MFSSLTNILGCQAPEGDMLQQKISETLDKVIEENKPKIAGFLNELAGSQALEALHSDAVIEKMARFIYPLVSGLVRMMVDEDMFVSFALLHRSLVVEKLSPLLK